MLDLQHCYILGSTINISLIDVNLRPFVPKSVDDQNASFLVKYNRESRGQKGCIELLAF